MTKIDQSLLDKIQKLLNLADPARGATAAEAQQAMARATELMAKYGIEQADLARRSGQANAPLQVVHKVIVLSRIQRCDYDQNIAAILKKCFGVNVLFTRALRDGRMRNAYVLIGDPMDVALAEMAREILDGAMIKGVRRYLREERGGEKWTARVGRSFYDGLTVGYCEGSEQGRAKAMATAKKEDADAFAIVLVDKEKAICAYTEEKFKVKVVKAGSRSGHDAHASQAGYREGSKLDLNGSSKALS